MAVADSFLVDAGAIAASVTAILVALGALARLRPLRWLVSQLVGKPVASWLKGQHAVAIEPVMAKVDEVGKALIDHMAAEEGKADADRADRETRQGALDTWRAGVDNRLDEGNRRFRAIEAKLDAAIGSR